MLVIGEQKRVGLARRAPSRFMTLVCLVAASLLLIFSQYTAQASVFEKARQSIVDAAEPALSLFSRPIQATGEAVGRVGDYFGTVSENRRLRAENARLLAWRAEALRLREEIAHFERVTNMPAPPTAAFVDARVIGEANGPYEHAFLVNAGRDDGVVKNAAVIDDFGLVGHVITAGVKASRVLLLTDYGSSVPVFVEGADEQAILSGRAEKPPVLKFVVSAAPAAIEPGQRVVTSGTGGDLPRGLPVGVVAAAGDEGATVALFADFDRTTLVRVIRYEFPSDADATPADADDADDVGDEASGAVDG